MFSYAVVDFVPLKPYYEAQQRLSFLVHKIEAKPDFLEVFLFVLFKKFKIIMGSNRTVNMSKCSV